MVRKDFIIQNMIKRERKLKTKNLKAWKARERWNSLQGHTKAELKRDLHLDSDVNVKYSGNREQYLKGKSFDDLSVRDKRILSYKGLHF